jgi:pimeloyl-ACP methyl ester carboxylesterase
MICGESSGSGLTDPGHRGKGKHMVRFSVIVRAAAAALMSIVMLAGASPAAAAQADRIGIVVMHGKGGAPNSKYIDPFARSLEARGLLVANLDMPWSRSRDYDVPTSRAEEEIEMAVAGLRAKGAGKVFLAGHSLGGAFAIHFAGKPRVDGVVAIAPGGNVAATVFRQKVGEALDRARELVAAGKGDSPERLLDFEPSRGVYAVVSPPAAYVTWFDPEGAMNFSRAARAVDPKVPVLFVVPTRDYPGLLKTSPQRFSELPKNPHTRLYEPSADHLNAPSASVDEIVSWIREVAGTAKP